MRVRFEPDEGFFRTVDLVRALARRGLSTVTGRDISELLLDGGVVEVVIPAVDNIDKLEAELAALAVRARVLTPALAAE